MSKQQVRTENAPIPAGPYSQGLRVGDFVFVAGQGPAESQRKHEQGMDRRQGRIGVHRETQRKVNEQEGYGPHRRDADACSWCGRHGKGERRHCARAVLPGGSPSRERTASR